MCVNCSPKKKQIWVFGFGALFLLLAILMGLLWPQISAKILKYNLELREGSMNYNNWIKTPLPMYLKIHLFNWTNPADFNNPNIKPQFVEMGPYVFMEKHERVNLNWNTDNDTVSYNQIRTWHFLPEMSNGKLDDVVTQVNVMTAAVAYNVRNALMLEKKALNLVLRPPLASLTVKKTVRELLFDGYDDKILDVLQYLKFLKFKIPFKKFGWFVERNNSATYDGRFEMYTGQKNFTHMGEMTAWNYSNKTNYYSGECKKVRGTSGELWPTNMNETGDITFFIPDVCHSLTLTYDKPFSLFGITGSKWVADARVFDNGKKYPKNSCYCTGERSSCPDVLSGVQNVSDCRFGAPVFASFPHYYLADPAYVNAVDGLSPNRSLHEFSLSLEPKTGIPLRVDAKLQINILLQKISGISFYDKRPDIMIPAFWFEQQLDLDAKLAKQASMAIQLPGIGSYVAWGVGGLGFILVLVGGIVTYSKRWSNYDNLDNDSTGSSSRETENLN